MDKETLIRLATPASIFVLALSIFSIPLKSSAVLGDPGTNSLNPFFVEITNAYALTD